MALKFRDPDWLLEQKIFDFARPEGRLKSISFRLLCGADHDSARCLVNYELI